VTVRLRRLRPSEAGPLRDLRLRALTEAPLAFAASVGEERRLPPEDWEEWARAGAGDGSTVIIVAVESKRWVGMIVGRMLEAETAWLEALWVDPTARGRGLGQRLIEAVADWARERGAARLDLSVTEGNRAASGLYARAGFSPTGRRRPLPADPARIEIFLSRAL
jgi:ribosomal protein S18 acetylase RimI-like enzyme